MIARATRENADSKGVVRFDVLGHDLLQAVAFLGESLAACHAFEIKIRRYLNAVILWGIAQGL